MGKFVTLLLYFTLLTTTLAERIWTVKEEKIFSRERPTSFPHHFSEQFSFA